MGREMPLIGVADVSLRGGRKSGGGGTKDFLVTLMG